MDPNLCQACRVIITALDKNISLYDEPHCQIAQVVQNATQGCPLCTVVREALTDEKIAELGASQSDIRCFVDISPYSTYLELSVHPEGSSPLRTSELLGTWELEDCTGEDTDSGTHTQPLTLPRHTNDNWTWNIIRRWIKSCCGPASSEDASQHRYCIAKSLRFLPTRLVSVADDNDRIRLCYGKDLDAVADLQYLTLSHCWGKIPMPLVTTSTNIADLMTAIPFHKLTRTFQHAVIATRRLGYDYIWIDSLCIIQGDAVDWAHEATLMTSVYAGGALNMVASAANDGNIGMFFQRTSHERLGCNIRLPNGKKKYCWRVGKDAFNVLGPLESETARRAWCFQERLLSPRNIFFSRNQVYWECRGMLASETHPDGEPDLSFYALPLESRQLVRWMEHPDELVEFWITLMVQYTQMHITYHKDKLVAIAGCARMVYEHLESVDQVSQLLPTIGTHAEEVYFAGLWSCHMEEQLAWHLDVDERRPRPEDDSFQAPSWSWASVASPVFYNLHDGTTLARVVEAHVNHSTSDEFGGVNGGQLRLTCKSPMEKITFNADGTIELPFHTNEQSSEHRIYWDTSETFTGTAFLLPIWPFHPLIVAALDTETKFRRLGMLEWEGREFLSAGKEYEVVLV